MNLDSFLESLAWRYAVKAFDPSKKVSDAEIAKLIEATILTPSSMGLQPWKFFVIQNQDIKNQLKPHAKDQSQISDCSHLVVLASKTSIDADYANRWVDHLNAERNTPPGSTDGYRRNIINSLSRLEGEPGHNWMNKQIYIALGVLLSACAAAKIDSCPMEGFDPNKFDELLGLPEKGFNARVLCAIGYRSENDKYSKMKKVRFPSNLLWEVL